MPLFHTMCKTIHQATSRLNARGCFNICLVYFRFIPVSFALSDLPSIHPLCWKPLFKWRLKFVRFSHINYLSKVVGWNSYQREDEECVTHRRDNNNNQICDKKRWTNRPGAHGFVSGLLYFRRYARKPYASESRFTMRTLLSGFGKGFLATRRQSSEIYDR